LCRDKTEFGLIPLDLEIWMGLIFVRFRSGPQPTVAELMQPVEAIRMPGRCWNVRNYIRLAPEPKRLPEHLEKAWIYYGIFPNMVISVMPESVQFYQEFPLSTGETLLRGAIYRYADESRKQAAARYLSFRIDRETMSEDVQLSVWSNESMMSEAFSSFYLSDLEYGVRTHHDHLRAMLPVLELSEAPDEREMWNVNEAMRSRG
jgi:phenylpropionate dioxygenase-like ring-hydroxylating dioxygenase large terminal subunit